MFRIRVGEGVWKSEGKHRSFGLVFAIYLPTAKPAKFSVAGKLSKIMASPAL
jgi:hypothetical protein